MNRRGFLLGTTAAIAAPVAVASSAEGVSADRIVFGQAAVFDGPASALGLGMRDGIKAAFAAEVKNLAMQTARATEEISTQIAGIQGATGMAASAIQNIAHMIHDLSSIATSIASAVEEQTMSTREIARNVQEAARSTTGVSNGIGDVSRVAEETGAAAQTVLDAARALGGAADNLQREMNSFVMRVRAA